MSKTYLNPPELFDSRQYGFSQGVVSPGGRHVHLSGQVAWNEKQEIVGDNLEAQVRQSLINVETAMCTAGGTLADVVSLRIYVRAEEMENNGGVSAGLKAFFSAETPPATTWIAVHGLARPEFLVEIEAVGIIEETARQRECN